MTLRVLICIPTYNNLETIERVVLDALEQTTQTILVIDDGSDDPVLAVLKHSHCLNALKVGRLQVLRSDKNCGKGFALQTGMKWAIEKGYSHFLAVDGDGQHLLREAKKLMDRAVENPWSLIIGKRRFESTTDVPEVSKFGRKFSNFWVCYQTGHGIQDSQSGYRLYPLFLLQNWKFWTKRYDFEIEVLIRLLWKQVDVLEVEIDVFYPPPDQRISHFNKWWDNVRISALNTVLVVVSLLKFNRTPIKSAIAFGLGIFIGCTPFFGLHTLIGAAVAFLFRLNALFLIVGTNISFPPIAAVLIPAEIAVGKRFSFSSSLINHYFLDWGIGSLVVGTILGLAGGFAVWLLTNQTSTRKVSNWTGKTRGGKFGNGFLKLMIRLFGVRMAYTFLWLVVPYFYLFAPKSRAAGNEYWSIMEPQKNWLARQLLVMKQMFRFGQVLMDRGLQSYHSTPQFQTRPHGMDQILKPIQQKQPLILITGHVGSWDLAASFLNTDGLDGQFHMVHYQAKELTFEKVIGKNEAFSHISSLLTTDEPILKIKQMLDQGEPVGLMGDRAMNTNVELVPFLGRLGPFDTRPFRIAATCGSRVLFTFGFKGKNNDYDLYASPSFVVQYQSEIPRFVQVKDWVTQYAQALEQVLKKYPEQWFNLYPFFSSVPQSPSELQGGKERNHLWQEWHTPEGLVLELGSDASTNA